MAFFTAEPGNEGSIYDSLSGYKMELPKMLNKRGQKKKKEKEKAMNRKQLQTR